MDEVIFSEDIMHYGTKRHSGRYPWGSGEDPYQHDGDFISRVKSLKKQGFTEQDIVKELGFKNSSEYRKAYTLATNERKQLRVDRAKSLKEDGLGASEIARKMSEELGENINESTVRSWLNPSTAERTKRYKSTAESLKEELKTKGYIDVGAGVERELGISRNVLDNALASLQEEGYNVVNIRVTQATDKSKSTIFKVLAPPGEKKDQQRELYQDPAKIQTIQDYYSEDGGKTWRHREYPASIDSKRVSIRYAEDGGIQKDGVIEIRPGCKDLDLGNSHYAQVRILVDGTHYLKGMAVYSDNLPDGVDIVFNTNKKKGTPMIDADRGVLKPIKDDPNDPFGAYIKADGQSWYTGSDGKKHLSAINKLKEEGDWEKMANTISSQFLSKQPLQLIKKQLDLTYSDYEAQFDEIMSITNPTVRKKVLREFSDECDSAVVDLKASAFPRQHTRVILPIPELKDDEVYAPYLRDGEKVALVRFPHGGTFEIPYLTVNNKNPAAKKALGTDIIDAIGINSKVAEQLSGADFDGDTATVIPITDKVKIAHRSPLKELEGFDPKTQYAYHDGMKVMTKANTQEQMGEISNLITDMTLAGAKTSEIARAVKHSMVVIDAAKHKLDYKQSEKDNGIAELKKKYQGIYDEDGNLVKSGGARTLLSRRKQTVRVDETRGSAKIDPETGELVYTPTGRTYVNEKGETVKATKKVPLFSTVKDLRTLSSGTPQEELYANYGNKLKDLANRARKAILDTPRLEYSPSARKTYATEVSSLMGKLNTAALNAPRERRAQTLANSIIKAKIQSNPELAEKSNKKELRKVQNAAIDDARASVGAKTQRIKVTQKEWEAIQAGAVSDNTLTKILRYIDEDQLKTLALPKTTTTLSEAKVAKLKAMRSSGYTVAEIADSLGVSTSTVSKYLK